MELCDVPNCGATLSTNSQGLRGAREYWLEHFRLRTLNHADALYLPKYDRIQRGLMSSATCERTCAELEGLECLDPAIHDIIGRAIAEALTERLMAPDG